MILTIPFYTPKNKQRKEELFSVLRANIKKKFIKKIILLIDDDTFKNKKLISSKLTIVRFNRRPTYADWIQESRKNINLDEYFVIANADIEFQDDFEELTIKELKNEKSILLLSRYELIGDKKLRLVNNPYYSQDTWCLKSKDLENIDEAHLSSLNIPLGFPRCDNKIAYEFWLRDWKLINPCLRIVTIHHQQSGVRNYDVKDKTIIGNVAYVFPSEEIAKISKVSLWLFTLTNRAPIAIRITNYLINDDVKENSKVLK